MPFNPLDHPILFSPPRYLQQSAWTQHIPFGMLLVDLLRPAILIELGTHYGTSYCGFCQAVDELKLGTRCYAVDTWAGDEHATDYGHGPDVLAQLRDHHDAFYGSFSRLLQMTFDEALEHFDDHSVDLLHIDGYHTYEAVRHDFTSWLPKLSSKGVVVFHDINVRRDDFGVWRFWETLKRQYRHMELFHEHGLGVALVGTDYPSEFMSFVQSSEQRMPTLRQFFSQMGQQVRRQEYARQVATERAQLVERYEAELTHLSDAIAETDAAHDQIAVQLEAAEADYVMQIGELEQQARAEIDRLQDEVRQELAELHRQNEHKLAESQQQYEASIAALEDQLAHKADALTASQQHYEASVATLQEQLAHQMREVTDLRADNSRLHGQLATERAQFAALENTHGWQMLQSWWQFKYRLLPLHSRRRRAFDLVHTSLFILFSQGPFAMLNRLRKWLRGERRHHMPTAIPAPSTPNPAAETAATVVSKAREPQAAKVVPKRLLYIVPSPELLSKRYRVYNVQEYASLAGIIVDTCSDIDLERAVNSIDQYDILILQRIAHSADVQRLLDRAKQHDIPTVFELDDFVFDLSVLPFVDGVRRLSPSDRELYISGVKRYRQTLLACDYFLGSTTPLANKAAELGKRSFVIRNGLNQEQLVLADAALQRRQRQPDTDTIRIGYLSGTATHDKDFAVALPALRRIMQEYPQVVLSIRGYLDVPPELAAFSDRIETHPFVHWRELIDATANLDVNIAPLELDNPYTDAKSELKYFEAALVQVPTVASATTPFSFAIDDGINGFLARDNNEWYDALKQLITDSELRSRIATTAHDDAMALYAPDVKRDEVRSVFRGILRDFQGVTGRNSTFSLRLSNNNRRSIAWITTTPARGSGGHRMILRVAHYLHFFGHDVRIYFVDDGSFSSPRELDDFIRENFIESPVECVLGVEAIESCDALIATTWDSAYIVHQNADKACQTYYFVQDYEPLFHVDDDYGYHKAKDTYALGLRHITIGPWLTKHLRDTHHAQADYFNFPIDDRVYRPTAASGNDAPLCVLFFARPQMPRRRYPLGIEALDILHRRAPEVEIVLFGSHHIDSASVPFPHTNSGVISDLHELAALYAGAAVGLVFSTTNPSVVPLEMMSCGCPVVELDNEINRVQFSNDEDVITLAPEDPNRIADAIYRLLTDATLRQHKKLHGLRFAKNLPTIRKAARRVEELILQGLEVKS